MTGNDVHARELAHDAFVRAWETLSMFRGESSFQSWLHRLVVNVVLQDARTTRRREARVRLVDDDETTAEVAVNSEGLDAITRMDLDEALARLAPDSRRVVVMHDIEGFRHEEIAQLLGVAAGTVRARLHHARKQLREWLTP
jgi:RNA polymerase sigma-70 factor (ECF subfamily)